MLRLASLYQNSSPYVEAVLNFIYPPSCIVCGARPEPNRKLVCESCWLNLPRLHQNDAEVLKIDDETDRPVLHCRAVWEFNDAVQAIIHELKYQGKKALAQPLGEEMAKAAAQDAEYAAAGTILPVPLHKTKFRERGYNQSLLLSAVVSEILNIPVETEVLKRVRYTKSQSRLNSAERDKNMQGAFQVVKPDLIQNNVTIVVDDVLTTGSTLRACARVLMEAGAAKVLALTAAKTP